MDNKEILTVSLKEYKKQIDDIKASLLTLQKGTKEYNDAANKAASMQDKLTTAMRDSKNGVESNSKSLAAMRQRLSEMKKEWSKMDVGSKEFKKATADIKKLSDEIGKYEQKAGDWRRNVGNYANSFAEGLSKSIPSIGNFNNALKMLAVNPVGAFLAAITLAIAALVKGVKSSQENMDKLNKILVPVNGAMKALQVIIEKVAGIALDGLSKGLEKVVGWFEKVQNKIREWGKTSIGKTLGLDKLSEGLDKFTESAKAQITVEDKLLAKEQELAKKRQEYVVKNAEDNAKLSKLRADASDSENKTIEERIAAAKKAAEIEQQILKRNAEIAKQEYEIAQARSEQSGSTNDELQNVADLKAAWIDAQSALTDAVAKSNKEIEKLNSKSGKGEQSVLKQRIAEIDLELKETQKGTDRYIELQREKIQKTLEVEKLGFVSTIKNQDERNAAIAAAELKSQKELEQAERKHQLTILEIRKQELTNWVNEYGLTTNEYKRRVLELREWELNNLAQMEGETDADFNKRKLDAQKAYNDAKLALDKQLLADEKLLLQNELNSLPENSFEYLKKAAEIAKFELDNMRQEEGESDEEFKARKLESEKKYNNMVKAEVRKGVDIYQAASSAIVGLLDTIARARQDDIKKRLDEGKITKEQAEEEFENAKALQYASATISMLQGIVTAISTAMQLGPIAGPIIGAINAATVAATGAMEIANIKNQKMDLSSSSSGSSISSGSSASYASVAPILNEQADLNNLNTIMGETVSQTNRESRVYILESDIQTSNNRVNVRESNSSF